MFFPTNANYAIQSRAAQRHVHLARPWPLDCGPIISTRSWWWQKCPSFVRNRTGALDGGDLSGIMTAEEERRGRRREEIITCLTKHSSPNDTPTRADMHWWGEGLVPAIKLTLIY